MRDMLRSDWDWLSRLERRLDEDEEQRVKARTSSLSRRAQAVASPRPHRAWPKRAVSLSAVLFIMVGAMSLPAWSQMERMARAISLTGTIAKIDLEAQQLKLKTGWFSSTVFQVDMDTKITDGQRSLSLNDLRSGEQATVEFAEAEKGQQPVVSAIIVQRAEGEGEPPSAQPPEPPSPLQPAAGPPSPPEAPATTAPSSSVPSGASSEDQL